MHCTDRPFMTLGREGKREGGGLTTSAVKGNAERRRRGLKGRGRKVEKERRVGYCRERGRTMLKYWLLLI